MADPAGAGPMSQRFGVGPPRGCSVTLGARHRLGLMMLRVATGAGEVVGHRLGRRSVAIAAGARPVGLVRKVERSLLRASRKVHQNHELTRRSGVAGMTANALALRAILMMAAVAPPRVASDHGGPGGVAALAGDGSMSLVVERSGLGRQRRGADPGGHRHEPCDGSRRETPQVPSEPRGEPVQDSRHREPSSSTPRGIVRRAVRGWWLHGLIKGTRSHPPRPVGKSATSGGETSDYARLGTGSRCAG